jgi:hypothetical protein
MDGNMGSTIGATRRLFLTTLGCVMLTALLLLGGCGSSGTLIVERRGDGEQLLESRFDSVIYRFEDDNGATLVMLRGTPERPEAAATIRLFWRPRAGTTPMDSTATNATMHYVLFGDGGALAIYSGAGFLLTDDRPGEVTFKGTVTGATLRLSETTEGFDQGITRADLRGKVVAKRNDIAASELISHINRLVRQRLGRARLVDAAAR